MGIKSDSQKLEVGGMVVLYELDAVAIGGDVRRFHGHLQEGPIVWQGNRYEPWAIQAEGFERTGDASQPTPTLSVGNIGLDEDGSPVVGVISSLCIHLNDLLGATLTVRQTLAKYLDAVNFSQGNPSADPSEEFPPEVWTVSHKTKDNDEVVEFQLTSSLNFNGAQLPGRPILATTCAWMTIGGYRGPYCGYTGDRYFDADDSPVFDPARDKCGGRLGSCQLRFGEWQTINFGGEPAADRLRG